MKKKIKMGIPLIDDQRLGDILCMADVMTFDEAAALAIHYGHQAISEKHAGNQIILYPPDGTPSYLFHENILSARDQAYAEQKLTGDWSTNRAKQAVPTKDVAMAFEPEHIGKLSEIVPMTTAINRFHAFSIALAVAHFLIEAKFNGTQIFVQTKDGNEIEMPLPEVLSPPKTGFQTRQPPAAAL